MQKDSTFRRGDLGAWAEDNRYQTRKDTASPFLYSFLEEGVAIYDTIIPDEKIEEMLADIDEYVARKGPHCHYLTDKETGEISVELFERHFNQESIDKHIIWTPFFREIAKELLGELPYIVSNIRVLFKLPGKRHTLIHQDYIWLNTGVRRDMAFAVHVQLTDPNLCDGGFAYLPATHRADSEGKMKEMPFGDYTGFKTIFRKKGEVVVMNCGVVHGSLPYTSYERRVSLFVQVISLPEALTVTNLSVRLPVLSEDNKRYIFYQ